MKSEYPKCFALLCQNLPLVEGKNPEEHAIQELKLINSEILDLIEPCLPAFQTTMSLEMWEIALTQNGSDGRVSSMCPFGGDKGQHIPCIDGRMIGNGSNGSRIYTRCQAWDDERGICRRMSYKSD
jgi:hypothetical protein